MKKILLISFCFLSVIFIYFNSSQNGNISNIRSHKIADEVTEFIHESKVNELLNNKYSKQEINILVRKVAHGFEFGVLSISIYLLLNYFSFTKSRRIIYTLIIVFICASCDELYQLTISGRNSSFKDVLIDFCGGCIGTYLICKIDDRRKNILNKGRFYEQEDKESDNSSSRSWN